ncbi:MAG: hypothetical protein ACJAYB_001013 [Psychromonas sp.]|jgi:hypothetical protein
MRYRDKFVVSYEITSILTAALTLLFMATITLLLARLTLLPHPILLVLAALFLRLDPPFTSSFNNNRERTQYYIAGTATDLSI